jgi:hypothetical protein
VHQVGFMYKIVQGCTVNRTQKSYCEVTDSNSSVAEVSGLLRCDVVSLGKWFPLLGGKIVPSS